MGHAHDDRLHAQLGGHIDDLLQGWDHDLATLQTEALLGGVLLGQKGLEAGGTGQTGQDQTLLLWREVQDAGGLETLADPVALLQGVDEHELHANLVAVDVLQTVQDFPEINEIKQVNLVL